jgi:tRNA(fMet)-specific endonuclease VapC
VSVWILDTDHVSLILRGHPTVTARLGQLSEQASTTIITVQEIFNGWMSELNQPNPNREIILDQYHHLFLVVELLKRLPTLEFDALAFGQYESLLVQNPHLRKKRLQKDLRIAAIALSRNAIVVTRNRRDFEQVPGLKIEDWIL